MYIDMLKNINLMPPVYLGTCAI